MGRPFIFSALSSSSRSTAAAARKTAEILSHVSSSPRLAAVVPASRLDVRPAPEMVSSGIPQLDALTGGLARGCLTEICGAASSGRTSVLLIALARATQRGEVCALVDTSDTFDPASAAAAGMEMSRLLWVRCGEKYPPRKPPTSAITSPARPHDSYRTVPSHLAEESVPERELYSQQLKPYSNQRSYRSGEPQRHPQSNASAACLDLPQLTFSRWELQLGQMLKVTDLLLQSNGFGMIALDLGDVPLSSARKIPLASWFRFRRAVEHTPTALLVLEQQPIAGSCSSVLLKVSGKKLAAVSSAVSCQLSALRKAARMPHAELLDQFEVTVELLRLRLERKSERKPVQSTASFNSRAAWAG